MRHAILLSAACVCFAATSPAAPPPAPCGPVPSAAQAAWHDLEMYAFCHFTTNTFTDKEWGFGDEDPAIFNPTAFDADQIVGTLARCGFKGVILTCKHHDGYCLWPTKTTGHNISKSPWKGGKGDMVKEFSDAARRHQIGFGVYLSPWDRNSEHYGTPRYVEIYREQLRELLTQYGPVYEVWHDGANGGDGFYGGKRGRRSIDHKTYYEWPRTWEMVRKLQPKAVIFSDVGPDLRWVGNESGNSPYPNWATFSPVGPDGGPAAPGYCRTQAGSPDGKFWMPAETDVSIRPGWFWHAAENPRVRTPKNLLDLYFNSVGRGTAFLLNVPPDRRGLIHENDVIALTGLKSALDKMFARNLAAGAKAAADVTRGPGFEPAMALDDDKQTYWAAPDGKLTASLELVLPEARRFSVIRLREPVRLGQRIRKFAVDVRENGAWREWIGNGSSIGPHVLLRDKAVTADAVRVRILEAAACPCLTEVSLWLEPDGVPDTLAPPGGNPK
jgi:alpha-L-fucosidase